MKKTTQLTGLSLLLVLFSCQIPNSDSNTMSPSNLLKGFGIKSVNSNYPYPQPSSNAPLLTEMPYDAPVLANEVTDETPDNFTFKKQTLTFDSPPPESINIQKGKIIVFYHNSDKFRVRTTTSVSSVNQSSADKINNILRKYKVHSVHSFAIYDQSEAKKTICPGENFDVHGHNDKDKFSIKHNEDNSHDDDHNNGWDHSDSDDNNNDDHHENHQQCDKCDSLNYTDSSVTTQAIAEEQQMVSKYFDGEIPDTLSVHIYEFPDSANTRQISAEIRNSGVVRTAYPALKMKSDLTPVPTPSYYPSSTPLPGCQTTTDVIGYTDISEINPSPPNDTGFTYVTVPFPTRRFLHSNELNDWYWFNKHKVFKGWNVYGNTPMPKIGIIDSGFDNSTSALDKPNYDGGYSIKFNYFSYLNPLNVLYTPWEIKSNDIQEDKNSIFSHGTEVASILGSPKGNGDGVCGIAPSAKIVGFRLTSWDSVAREYSADEIAFAILLASGDQSLDAINISIGSDDYPLSSDPLDRLVLAIAVSKGKPVVISAGNKQFQTDNDSVQGVTIVGGTTNFNPSTRIADSGTYIWDNGDGSNYGKSVDLAASADNLVTTHYEAKNNIRIYVKDGGTSLAAPMVTASIGMVKKIAEANGVKLDPFQLKHIISYSSTLAYDGFGSHRSRYLGIDLQNTTHSPNQRPNIRNLNLFNALTIAKNLSNYSVIARIHNVDDYSVININGGNQRFNSYGSDDIIGIKNPNMCKSTVSFKTLNSGGGYTYGYQLYYGKKYDTSYSNTDFYAGYNFFDLLDGAAGTYGAENNISKPYGYLAPKSKIINGSYSSYPAS